MDIQTAIVRVIEQTDLTRPEMAAVMRQIMSGDCTPAQIGGLLVGLRMKGESIDEIAGAAQTMRELAIHVDVDPNTVVDTSGTGGDGLKTFNISTTASFVAAAAGARVAKHGNRSVSSSSGSADLLEALGVNINLDAAANKRCIETVGIGFMFAPGYHQATRHAVGPRRELGVRTLFNVLGPLTNPARPTSQVVGIFSRTMITTIAEVLKALGSRHVMVVSGADGSDELSITGATHVAELKNDEVTEYTLDPTEFGLATAPIDALHAGSVADSVAIVERVLGGDNGPQRDVVVLNAAAALYVAGVADSIGDGINRAAKAIDSGAARQVVQRLVEFTNE